MTTALTIRSLRRSLPHPAPRKEVTTRPPEDTVISRRSPLFFIAGSKSSKIAHAGRVKNPPFRASKTAPIRRAIFMGDMLILASASPRRHELLLAAGLPHIVRPSAIPEEPLPAESPTAFVQRIAQQKARAVPHDPADIVLAADTVVSLSSGPNSEIFGKPRDDDDARRMLRLLSGRDHFVYTGICLLAASRVIVDLATTTVSFAPLTDREIEEYTRSGETRDKAGAYAIQGWASRFVTQVQGSYHNVVGLPVSLVYSHLKSL